jgi:ATP-dependent Lon protease
LNEADVIIPDETIQYIVSNEALTKDESGVRNLKRCLEIIYTKLNLFRLMKADTSLFGKDLELKVTFPFTVEKKEVDALIKNDAGRNQSLLAMYV